MLRFIKILCTVACSLYCGLSFAADFHIRYKYEDEDCLKATDPLNGDKLIWFRTNIQECGFDMGKPDRQEPIIISGKCLVMDVYVSKTGLGERKVYSEDSQKNWADGLPLEKCGFTQPARIEYRLNGNDCRKYSIKNSTIQTIPPLEMIFPDKISISVCGFDKTKTQTTYEIIDNKCIKIKVMINGAGQRITEKLGESGVESCGINIASGPVSVAYSSYPRLGFIPIVSHDCYKINSFLSQKGLGIYWTTQKVSIDLCNPAPASGAPSPMPPAIE